MIVLVTYFCKSIIKNYLESCDMKLLQRLDINKVSCIRIFSCPFSKLLLTS